MRCALINTLGSENPGSHSPSLGLAYIAANLEKYGHKVIIIDRPVIKHKKGNLNLVEIDKKMVRQLNEFTPDIVGLTAMTIQIYDLSHTAELVKSVTRNNIPIIGGGFHPTAEAILTLTEIPAIDIICRGEGEFTMLDLANKKTLKEIDGISYKENDKIIHNKDRELLRDLDLLPFPARHLLDMEYYSRRNDLVIACLPLRVATQMTSRGCPFNCSFCSSKLIYKARTYHSPEYVLKEMSTLVENYPIEAIRFVDCEMLPTRSRLEKICEGIISLKLNKKVQWGCSMRANLVDKEILSIMKEAGCVFINYGFESGSQRMLDGMNKQIKLEENYNAAKITNDAGILVNSDMIINLPNETEKDIEQTIEFIEKNKKYIYSMGTNHLLPLPGSPYYKEFLDKGLLKYSSDLWGEIGVLTKSIDDIKLYTNVSRQKFIELFKRIDRITSKNNIEKYIKYNWYRHPFSIVKRFINSFNRFWGLFVSEKFKGFFNKVDA